MRARYTTQSDAEISVGTTKYRISNIESYGGTMHVFELRGDAYIQIGTMVQYNNKRANIKKTLEMFLDNLEHGKDAVRLAWKGPEEEPNPNTAW